MGRAPFSAPPAAPPSNAAVPQGGMRPGGPGQGPGPGQSQGPGPGQGRPLSRDPSDRRTLVVGRGISLQGTVQDAERLVVEGTVEASMIHATELSVSPGGVFKGEVEVEDAEVAGTIDGTLTARGSLIVRNTGRVLGTARCRRLQVEDGGQITGRIEMLTEGSRSESVRPTAESTV
ncbi:MAG: polymer-forming cytoskeletal protein [Acidisphaera sp.]|nr:polymer-forming cytoskeletal protein [Acidisphaera sp.]